MFRYEVTRGSPADTTGLNLSTNALRTEGGSSITAVSDGIPAVSGLSDYAALLPVQKIDPTAPLTGGVCARTPAIIPAIMALASQDPAGAPANCSEVTEQKLRAGIAAGGGTFNLNLHGLKLSSLKSGDFDWLNGMQTLNLSENQLTSLPTRLFEGLNGMQTLNLRNNQLTSLPTRLFEGLNGIQTLNLGHNQLTSLPTRLFEELETLQRIQLESNQLTSLAKDTFASTPNLIEIDLRVNRLGASSLPDGIFEPLTKLLVVRLQGNPGTKSFKPMADAGEGRTVSAGETVTLSGTSTGPWGSNVTYAWRPLSATGEPVSTVELSATDVAEPTFTVPVLDEETTVKFELKLRGRGTFGETHTSQPSEAVFTIKRLAVTGFTAASSPTTGAHFRMGETLEIAASFSDKVIVDTSGGTPRLALAIGASVGNPNRNAEYVRGSGTTELIFAYTVMRMDADNTGVSIAQNGLKANGGNITSVYGAAAPLAHASVSNDTDLRVDWTMSPPSGGVCARTPQVRSELVTLVKESDSTVTDCSMVTTTHLAGLTGTLDLSQSNVGQIRTLKHGDFEGLSALTSLTITSQSTLQRVPAGVFDPMTSLTTLRLDSNGNATDTGLSTLPPGVFDQLTGLRTLNLSANDLATLAPRIFERLTAATQISVGSNPGTASFKPIAMAGPTGGIDAGAGTTVTLGVEDAQNGFEDPWGTNVTYAWRQTAGTTATLSSTVVARPTFTAAGPNGDETATFALTVTGKGGRIASTSTTNVRIATGPAITALEWVSTPRSSQALTISGTQYYSAGETIELGVRFERAVTVDTTGGTPSIVLELEGQVRKNATYRSGSGTAQLVFGYTVETQDRGREGVLIPANSLALNGGAIKGAADNGVAIGHRKLDRDGLHGVWGSLIDTDSGGVCDRTSGVAAAIIANVRNREFDPQNRIRCDDIGATRLAAITGTLDVSPQATASGRMTSLKAGDFAGLTALTGLNLNDHALRIFPAGVFDPLTALTSLTISYNQTQATDSLMTLPAGLFDRLTRLQTLRLTHNDLEKLPNALFEDLVNLRTLALNSNPGTASFVPAVNSGADAEIDARAGDTVTLDATGDVTRGPWGTNVSHAWRQVSGPTVTVSSTSTAKPTFTAPTHADGDAQTLVFEDVVTGTGTATDGAHRATATVTVEIAEFTQVSDLRTVSESIADDGYKRGEAIEIGVTFTNAVTITGTPQIALTIGANTRNASYHPQGSGTRFALFRYTVATGDTDNDGFSIPANALALNAGTIVDAQTGARASLDHSALTTDVDHRVSGAQVVLSGGICDRTVEVRAVLVEDIEDDDASVTNCSQVTSAHLAALTGTLALTTLREIRAFKTGDFAGLSAITTMFITGKSHLQRIPAGLFDEMTSLTSLNLQSNGNSSDTGLNTLPAGLFDRLTGLTSLDLSNNDLTALPPRIFENLVNLGSTGLKLSGNPGSASFVPIAKAGPDGGFDVTVGSTVTLGVEGAENGFDDPWGSNVTNRWFHRDGPTATEIMLAQTARPTFTPETEGTYRFSLRVEGKGTVASVWQKTPTPARNLRRTATLSARFRPRNRPHRHH